MPGRGPPAGDLNPGEIVTDVQSSPAPSRLSLDVTGASTTDGAPVQLWTCSGGTKQRPNPN
ncbi:RICIN domain-containing protein [Streptomyces resistomycificus]|uniref:Uncharacterized protein n=1 Tax=Streptomyces resistomycificus TaxID=67356 RepID=A0A0L8KPE0_9ACTN|nr:RICIN domain-containing protein [Streptomyces resistomycificus]KOG27777.1 hypothetical protein ADK37_40510 [Streptomyces resistomycificus]KUN96433.1 hypothetical protein AQJ84_18785 [Streptomyces resistomycificus]